MSAFVLDASAAANFLLPDESNAYGEEVLRHLEKVGALVPVLWNYEVGNLLAMAVRRRRIDDTYRQIALGQLLQLPLTYWDAAGSSSLIHAQPIASLADTHMLSFYDATYLHIALTEKRPLATLDMTLRQAAHECGVQIFGKSGKWARR